MDCVFARDNVNSSNTGCMRSGSDVKSEPVSVYQRRDPSCDQNSYPLPDPNYNGGCSSQRQYFPRFYDNSPPQCMYDPGQWAYMRERKIPGMSIWGQTQQLPPDLLKHVQTAYSTPDFPLQLRHYFADWIEDQPWQQINEDSPQHETYATQLYKGFIDQIEKKAMELENDTEYFYLKLAFEESSRHFQRRYDRSPMDLVRLVKKCLALEESLISQHKNPVEAIPALLGKEKTIMDQIEDLGQKINATDQDLKHMANTQEIFIVQYQKQLEVQNRLNKLQQASSDGENEEQMKTLKRQKQEIEEKLTSFAHRLLKLRIEMADKHLEIYNGLKVLQEQVVDKELIEWKRKQQFAGNGAPFDSHMISSIQKWVEALAEMVWKTRQQILQVEVLRTRLPIAFPQGQEDILPQLNSQTTGMLSSLVTSTFIVETQPPQVLKRDSRFSAKVRLLVGGKLSIHMSPPTVTASIISEVQARQLLQNNSSRRPENTSGKILNNLGLMEFQAQKGELSVEFRNMNCRDKQFWQLQKSILKQIKRADRRGTEAVTEEKFCILFQSSFQIGSGELQFEVWTLSLPVVVTVHGNQECNAMATILWDNQFNEQGRTPFVVPEQVAWPELADMLDTKFKSYTGRGMTQENKQYLATKLFGGKVTENFNNRKVTWAMFNRDTLAQRNFSFWEWFYNVMKLTKEYLKGPWMDGHIHGFIGKVDSQDTLRNCKPGTFLLRFSDNFLGGVTIAWSAEDKNGEKNVWNLHPFSFKDFPIRGLAERIMDLPQLEYLYPSVSKQQAFGKFLGPTPAGPIDKNGYVIHQIITVSQTDTSLNRGSDYPPSPAVSDCQPGSPEAFSPQPGVSSQDIRDVLDISNMDLTEVTMDYNPEDMFENINTLIYGNDPNTPMASIQQTFTNFPSMVTDDPQ